MGTKLLGQMNADADSGGKIRVLLADDHEVIRSGLANLLNDQADMQVVAEAEDGVEAVEQVRRCLPDVAVLDVTMPRMTGLDAARQIGAEFAQVRMIGLSMHQAEDMAGPMKQVGVDIYLTKAGPVTELIGAIRQIMQR